MSNMIYMAFGPLVIGLNKGYHYQELRLGYPPEWCIACSPYDFISTIVLPKPSGKQIHGI